MRLLKLFIISAIILSPGISRSEAPVQDAKSIHTDIQIHSISVVYGQDQKFEEKHKELAARLAKLGASSNYDPTVTVELTKLATMLAEAKDLHNFKAKINKDKKNAAGPEDLMKAYFQFKALEKNRR